jgi:P4 family phage/plasmid primase-like protien
MLSQNTSEPAVSQEKAASNPTQVPFRRKRRIMSSGSVDEIAEWLLGTIGDPSAPDFGALQGLVFAEGQLWRCDPDHVWRPFREGDAYQLIERFDGAEYTTPEGKLRAVQMSPDLARRAVRAIELKRDQRDFFRNAMRGRAFRNGFLRIPRAGRATLEPLTPEHHARVCHEFDVVLEPTPEQVQHWTAFVTSMWPDDFESRRLLHETIGYLLSGENWAQKAFLFLGVVRGGKGTIAKLLDRMLKTVTFKLTGLGERFALQPWLGAELAIDRDFRRSQAEESKAVARFLSVSSAEPTDVERKNQPALPGEILPARMLILTNPPFSIRDLGGAVSTRIVILPFVHSFLGKEDYDLEDKLMSEIGAIMGLCVRSLEVLHERGRFAEPASARELRAQVEAGETPLKEFFDEWCAFELEAEISTRALYDAMKLWAKDTGRAAPSDQSFADALRKRDVVKVQPRANGVRQSRVYRGVRLLPAAESVEGQQVLRAAGQLAAAPRQAKVIPISRAHASS